MARRLYDVATRRLLCGHGWMRDSVLYPDVYCNFHRNIHKEAEVMNRDEQEMALWREAYSASRLIARIDREAEADAAVEAFRKRYPPQPTAPEAVWYDEPPFPKDGTSYPCWIAGQTLPSAVYWGGREWRVYIAGDSHVHGLHGRRVFPIVKPPEPTT